jgi:outer membrane protein assembly factor BamB
MSNPNIVFFAFILFVSTGLIEAADWPRFRGADGNASAPSANVPLTWSATENIARKVEIAGNGASSPSVFSGRVYLTSFTGYGLNPDDPGNREDLQQHVLCFDLNDGKLLWDQSTKASESEQKATRRVADHGYATGTAVCDDRGVYAYFGVSGLVAYGHEGNLLWQAKTGDGTKGFGSAASPILYRDLVIINAASKQRRFSPSTELPAKKSGESKTSRAAGQLRLWPRQQMGETN